MARESGTFAPTLANTIRRARERSRLNVRELARKAGISHTQISRLEAGRVKKPSREVLVAIARGLDQNPMPLLVLAGHLDRAAARDALRPFFREGSELVEDWGHWEKAGQESGLSLARASELVRDPGASEGELRQVAAELFGYAETVETEWDDAYALAAVRGEQAEELRQFLEIWRYVRGDLRKRWLDYGRQLRRVADLEWQAESAAEQLAAEISEAKEDRQ